MKKRLIYIIIISTLSAVMLRGQTIPLSTDQLLEKLYDRLVNNYEDADRLRINDSIKLIIEPYVNSDTIFNHRFSNLRYLGQITSPDSLIKIVTWNLILGGFPSRYYSYIIRRGDQGKENIIYRLMSEYREAPLSTDTVFYGNEWYGALYYDARLFLINDRKYWVLLGIDYGNPFVSRKIIEVISFTPDNSILFGLKWFSDGEAMKYREVFEYASNATMSLRFRTDSTIVFDHLVPFSPAMKGDRQYYGPDYSTDAYIFDHGIWKLKINIDARNRQ